MSYHQFYHEYYLTIININPLPHPSHYCLIVSPLNLAVEMLFHVVDDENVMMLSSVMAATTMTVAPKMTTPAAIASDDKNYNGERDRRMISSHLLFVIGDDGGVEHGDDGFVVVLDFFSTETLPVPT